MKNNGYKIVECKCKKHYLIANPYNKNEKPYPCFLADKMTKKQAEKRCLELPNAKEVAEIYNYNAQFSY